MIHQRLVCALWLALATISCVSGQEAIPRINLTGSPQWPCPKVNKAVYDVPSLLGAPEAGGQRNADMHFAYPIIYIHGLLGDNQTWADFTDWFSGLGGDPSTIGYCLNADGSFSNADLEDDFFGPFGSFCANDSYVMTFKCNAFGQCMSGEGYYEVQSSASAFTNRQKQLPTGA